MKTYIINIFALTFLYGCTDSNKEPLSPRTCIETPASYLVNFKLKRLSICLDSLPKITDTSYSFSSNANSAFSVKYSDQYDFEIKFITYDFKTPNAEYTLVEEHYSAFDNFNREQIKLEEVVKVYKKGDTINDRGFRSFAIGPSDSLSINIEYDYLLNPINNKGTGFAKYCTAIPFDTSILIRDVRVINFHNSKRKHRVVPVNKKIKCNSNEITELFTLDKITYGITTYGHVHKTSDNRNIILTHVIYNKTLDSTWSKKKIFYNESTSYIYADEFGYGIDFWLANKDTAYLGILKYKVPNFKNYP